MVDQPTSSPAEELFRVKYNIGLTKTLEILQDRIEDNLTGTLYNTDVQEAPKDWKAEILRDPEIRPDDSKSPLQDFIIYPSDLSLYLRSIYDDLQTKPEFLRLQKAVDNTKGDKENKTSQAFNDFLIDIKSEADKDLSTFPTDLTTQKYILDILIELIEASIVLPTDLITTTDEAQDETTSSEVAQAPVTTAGVPSRTTGSTGDSDQNAAESDGDQPTDPQQILDDTKPTSQLEKVRQQHQAIQIHSGFIYNHIAQDLASIYGVDQKYFLDLPPEIQAAIRSQIAANLYTMDPSDIAKNRLQLEKKILQQIFIFNPGLSFQIQESLINRLTAEKASPEIIAKVAQATNIYDLGSIEHNDQLFEHINDLTSLKNRADENGELPESDVEKNSRENLRKKYQLQTIGQIDHELNQLIGEAAIELPTPAIRENIIRVVDSKILMRLDPREVNISGLDNQQQKALREVIEIYWYKKLGANSRIVSKVDENFSTSALALEHSFTKKDLYQRNGTAKQLQQEKTDLTALYIAKTLPQDLITHNQHIIAQQAMQNQLEQGFAQRTLVAAEQLRLQVIFNENQRLEAIQQAAHTQYLMTGRPSGEIQDSTDGGFPGQIAPDNIATIANQRGLSVGSKRSNLAKDAALKMALNAASQAIPHLKAAMLIWKHRKLIIAAAAAAAFALALLIAYLLQFISLIVGLMVLAAAGIMAPSLYLLLGRENVEKIGNFTLRALPNLFNPAWWAEQTKQALQKIDGTLDGFSNQGLNFARDAGSRLKGLFSPSAATLEPVTLTVTQVAIGGAIGGPALAAMIYAVTISPFLQPIGEYGVDPNQLAQAEITIRKSNDVDGDLQASQTITYNLTIDNNTSEGSSPITQISIIDTLAEDDRTKINPDSFNLIETSEGISCQPYSNYVLTCQLAALEWNESAQISYSLTTVNDTSVVTPDGETTVRNLAEVEGLLDGRVVSNNSRNTANGGAEDIAIAAEEIMGGLQRAWWSYYNYHPQYPQHFNLGRATNSAPWGGRPLPCNSGCPGPGEYNGNPEILFWCTWGVIYSYEEAGRPFVSSTAPGSLLSVWYMRSHFINSNNTEYIGVNLDGSGRAPTFDQIQVGDVAFFGKSGGSSSAHVAIIKYVDSSVVITLDANNWRVENTYTVGRGGTVEQLGSVKLNGVGRLY